MIKRYTYRTIFHTRSCSKAQDLNFVKRIRNKSISNITSVEKKKDTTRFPIVNYVQHDKHSKVHEKNNKEDKFSALRLQNLI